jgi:hypothetical protein
VLTALLEPSDGVRWAGNVVFALLAAALLAATAGVLRADLRRSPPRRHDVTGHR